MGRMGYGYGSEWHLLRYLGYHREKLNSKIKSSIFSANRLEYLLSSVESEIEWLDFPFSGKREKLKDDREFEGLEFLGLSHALLPTWKGYWPTTGKQQNWDAIGRLTSEIDKDKNQEWLLVEAKAHIDECRSPCQAGPKSLTQIEKALDKTAINVTHLGIKTGDWMTEYYQYVNRLAILDFLISHGVNAKLIFIYFCDENASYYTSKNTYPKSEADWEVELLKTMYAALDIDVSKPLMKRVHHVFLDLK